MTTASAIPSSMAIAVSMAVSIPMADPLDSASLRAASKQLIDVGGHRGRGVENAIWQTSHARCNDKDDNQKDCAILYERLALFLPGWQQLLHLSH